MVPMAVAVVDTATIKTPVAIGAPALVVTVPLIVPNALDIVNVPIKTVDALTTVV